ncbi:DUF3293 domain-containing protein [Frateuria sp.]|uniref:DUF3293 domain-containing protein n=1 Tax=Frateuria sp. TaxID=2211372 RepID=UPI001817679A|nr:DUF3293 domain-containing protein [Frateuria sp.]NUR23469.1 DUF3293 domain-containing protein [Frateuria sp.]
MDEELRQSYLHATYRVRVCRRGAAILRIGEPLPRVLQPLAGDRSWGFLTAWNPRSQRQQPQVNRAAQLRLVAELRSDPALDIHPALGSGSGGWREPSLWIVGIAAQALAQLGDRYGQNAWLSGHGAGVVELRLR